MFVEVVFIIIICVIMILRYDIYGKTISYIKIRFETMVCLFID